MSKGRNDDISYKLHKHERWLCWILLGLTTIASTKEDT